MKITKPRICHSGNLIRLVSLKITLLKQIPYYSLSRIEKHLVEEKEILDSLHYAKKIQTPLMTGEKIIEKNLIRLNKKRIDHKIYPFLKKN